ncbi:MAG: hypothetical protein AAF250_13410 [Pseudomonadota bacterium]
MAHKPLSSLGLGHRMLGAMGLTAVIAPTLNALVILIETSGSAADLSFLIETGQASFGLMVFTFFGLIFAIPSAIVLGCVIELPKTSLLGRYHAIPSWIAFSMQLLVSVLGALPLMIAANASLLHIFRGSKPFYDHIFLPFMIGGLVSAVSWWILVAVPLRRIRRLEAKGEWEPEPHRTPLAPARRLP